MLRRGCETRGRGSAAHYRNRGDACGRFGADMGEGNGQGACVRLVIKLSGEALGGPAGSGLDPAVLRALAGEVVAAAAGGAQLALVLGGGNVCRGATLVGAGIGRVTGDHMGMLATIINALAFRDALRRAGAAATLLSSHAIAQVAPGYSAGEARARLAAGDVVLLAGGTGNPLFTTDTAACLRGVEIGADLAVKATKVDGVYSADPLLDPEAERFDRLTYREVLTRRLRVMDMTAIALCEEHALPLVVCDIGVPGTLTKVAAGAKVGTRICA